MKNGDSDARRATMLHLRELLTVATTVTTFAACQSEDPPPATVATLPPTPTGQVLDATTGVVVDAGEPTPDVVDAADVDATIDASVDAPTDAPTDARPHRKRDAGVAKPLPPPHGYHVVDMLPPPARHPPRSKP